MIRKSDVQWWVLEAKNHPESAPMIIEKLAERLVNLDAENERLRNEIIRLQNRGVQTREATTSRDEVEALKHRVETLESLLDDRKSTEASLVFVSGKGHAARLPFSAARQMARQGQPALEKKALLSLRRLLLARAHEELLLLTDRGRGYRVPLHDLPTLDQDGRWPEAGSQRFETDERTTAVALVGEPPRFWTVVTRRGYVQRFVRVAFDRRLSQGEQLIQTPLHNDAPVAIVSGDWGDLLLITRWGQGMRFSHRAIEGQGTAALELERDDEVVAALSLPQDSEILIATAGGYAIRRDSAQISAKAHPGGAGRRLIQAHDVLTAFRYAPDAHLLALTYSGKLTFLPMTDLPLQERATKGTMLRDMSLDPARAMTWDPPDLLAEER